MPAKFCKVSRTPPSTGWIPATQQSLVRWEEWRISSLPGSLCPEAKLHWPGVSRTALGVAQPRTGHHAYLNCRRRLIKTNVNASPVSERASILRRTWSECARVHWCGRHSGTIPHPRRPNLGTRNAWVCVRRNRFRSSIGGKRLLQETGDFTRGRS
jgi:hypothetical protein